MTSTEAEVKRQFVNFRFFKVQPEWRRLDPDLQKRGKEEANRAFQEYASKMILLSYTTVGIRSECDFMFWRISESLEIFEEMSARFFKTGFGKYVTPVYSYLAMTKRSSYIDKISPEHTESRTRILPGKYKYLFVYPFVKKREWYLLSYEQRQAMMDDHIRVGGKYPSVKLNTTYSFGLDDQEFVLAFETNEPKDFLDLVMELRESKASSYTLRDTPTFTTIRKPFEKILDDF
ncbi:MAG: chlorite dismutase family protein [Elusimicrobia bacterium]|nr:chlorite dismutase family protein [Elusimicrobiota bacterium]